LAEQNALKRSWTFILLSFVLSVGISDIVHGSEWDGVDGALRSAAYDGDVQRAKAALAAGANINGQTESDKPTPLMYAAKNGHISVVRFLLMRGASANVFTSNGQSAIALALQHGHPDTAVVLLEHGANPNTRSDATGLTLLEGAAWHGYTELFNKLLENGANLDLGDLTALEIAAQLGRVQMVEELLRRGADVNLNPDGQLSALDVAKIEGHTDVIEMLTAAGAAETQAEEFNSPADAFKEILITHLADAKLKREVAYQDAEGYFQFGKGICEALREGLSKNEILEDSYYHFWGVEISDALWESALETICPELAP
jgi:ankyrin repeat protein